YGALLGFEEIAKPAGLANRGGCWFRVGKQELHVGVDETFVPAHKAHPGIAVSSAAALQEIAARLEAAGAEVQWADPGEIGGRSRFHVPDPWGNRLEL